jgi:hypothetical protein
VLQEGFDLFPSETGLAANHERIEMPGDTVLMSAGERHY